MKNTLKLTDISFPEHYGIILSAYQAGGWEVLVAYYDDQYGIFGLVYDGDHILPHTKALNSKAELAYYELYTDMDDGVSMRLIEFYSARDSRFKPN